MSCFSWAGISQCVYLCWIKEGMRLEDTTSELWACMRVLVCGLSTVGSDCLGERREGCHMLARQT